MYDAEGSHLGYSLLHGTVPPECPSSAGKPSSRRKTYQPPCRRPNCQRTARTIPAFLSSSTPVLHTHFPVDNPRFSFSIPNFSYLSHFREYSGILSSALPLSIFSFPALLRITRVVCVVCVKCNLHSCVKRSRASVRFTVQPVQFPAIPEQRIPITPIEILNDYMRIQPYSRPPIPLYPYAHSLIYSRPACDDSGFKMGWGGVKWKRGGHTELLTKFSNF